MNHVGYKRVENKIGIHIVYYQEGSKAKDKKRRSLNKREFDVNIIQQLKA